MPPYGNFQLFHSRRIGRAPGRLPLGPNDVVVDRPDETTILGAAKVTGKRSKWTYGALTAATGREYADVDTPIVDGSGVTRTELLIEPATSYNVARIQRDVMGSSNIGALVTGVFRERADDAFTGGIDHNLRWDQNRVRWDGHWVVTHAPGPDGMKTSGGGVTNFNVSRKNFNIGTHYDHFGRDFRVNDIGFFRTRANRNQAEGYAEVGQPDPWKIFRRFWGFSSYGYGWTDERLIINDYFETGVSFQFLNYWNFNFGGGRQGDVYDDLDTRGGPPIFKPGSQFLFYNANSDSRKRWQLNLGGNFWRNAVGGSGGNARAGVSFQPNDRILASVSANYSAGIDIAQWIVNQDPDGDGVLDHVYGTLDRDVVDMTFRTTYSFNRDLTVQMYLQPFVAVGDYGDIRRLARAYSFEFEPVDDRLRSGLQHQVASRKCGAAVGVPSRKHAVRGVGYVSGRLLTSRPVQPLPGPRRYVRRQRNERPDGKGDLLVQPLVCRFCAADVRTRRTSAPLDLHERSAGRSLTRRRRCAPGTLT